MTRYAPVVLLVVAALGCGNSQVNIGGTGSTGSTGTSASGTSGTSTTSASSSSTGGTTASTSSSGTTSAGTTTAASGTTTGIGTSTGSGTTTGGGTTTTGSGTTGVATAGTTSGTTGPNLGGPFVPYDGGPRTEPVIDTDAGCTALQPHYDPNVQACVECIGNADCLTGQVCEQRQNKFTNRCVQCSETEDCPTGETCNAPNLDIFWTGTDMCQADCRNNPGMCAPGACETDAGVCYNDTLVIVFQITPVFCGKVLTNAAWCLTDSDCQVDGGAGGCIFTMDAFPWTSFPANPFGYCVECKVDGGPNQCAGPNAYCNLRQCYADNYGLPQDGVAGTCTYDCFLDAGVCPINTYCADAGLVSFDGGTDSAVPAGACAAGCLDLSNCGGTVPICSNSACVQCAVDTDCPDWAPGCLNNLCNGCAQNSDCPATEQCMPSGRCGCFADTDCPLDLPTCVGGDLSSSTFGVCACTASTVCGTASVCETRFPYAIVDANDLNEAGGACIKACATNADCTTNFPGSSNLLCDTTTGYCVGCMADSDCTASADPTKPYVTPSCLLYPDGGDPTVSPPLVTGGGQCGCNDTSQCNGGFACQSPGYTGTCVAPCLFANGIDSCAPRAQPGTCNNAYPTPPFCNTNTGLCQECLDDYDCTTGACYLPVCNGGHCIACLTGDDCQEYAQPFPNYACGSNVCSAMCSDVSQCPTDGGYGCLEGPLGTANACLITCVLGDDAGMGTVSDAGNPCPAQSPLCVPNPFGADSTSGVCGQCLSANDQTNCTANACINGGNASCDGLTCTITCF